MVIGFTIKSQARDRVKYRKIKNWPVFFLFLKKYRPIGIIGK
jgi:hypothetical protein